LMVSGVVVYMTSVASAVAVFMRTHLRDEASNRIKGLRRDCQRHPVPVEFMLRTVIHINLSTEYGRESVFPDDTIGEWQRNSRQRPKSISGSVSWFNGPPRGDVRVPCGCDRLQWSRRRRKASHDKHVRPCEKSLGPRIRRNRGIEPGASDAGAVKRVAVLGSTKNRCARRTGRR